MFSNQITIFQIYFEIFDARQIYTREKSKYLNSIRVFPFFVSFLCWNEINNKSSIKEGTRKMENCKANHILDRSSRPEVFCRKDALENFAKFTGKRLCQSLWFLAGFIKRDTPTKLFSCEFCEISKNIFLIDTCSGCFC